MASEYLIDGVRTFLAQEENGVNNVVRYNSTETYEIFTREEIGCLNTGNYIEKRERHGLVRYIDMVACALATMDETA